MSINLMTKAWAMQGLNAGQKLVLLALCDNSSDEGCCWPSISTIAKKCCMSERAVQGHISHFEDAGMLKRHERKGRSTVYEIYPSRICTPAESALPPPQNLHPTPAESAPRTINEPSVEPVTPLAPKGAALGEAAPAKRKGRKVGAVAFPEWLKTETDAGRKFIPPSDPILTRASRVGLSVDHVELAIEFFADRYSNERRDAKYVDWRATFRDHLKRNFLKLWYRNSAGEWVLSVVGHQAAQVFGASNE